MIEALFTPEFRESAVEQIQAAADPTPPTHRNGVASAIERLLLPHVERVIASVHASGRGLLASEFNAADALRSTAENTANFLRISAEGSLSEDEAAELADALDNTWLAFVAAAAAHRIYDDLLRDDKTLGAANDARAVDADLVALEKFSRWQASRRQQLTRNGAPLPADERLRKFQHAAQRTDRPSEREYRRLRKLLKAGRIPAP
jgi:hypothetical protein